MSLTSTMCNTLQNQLDKYNIALNKTLPGLDGVNTLITDLGTFSASSQGIVDQALLDMDTILNNTIPDFTAPENVIEVANFIQNCTFLQTHDLLSKSLTFVNGMADILKSTILNAFLSLGIPEITLSIQMVQLDITLKSLGINQYVPDISRILTCLNSVVLCNRDMSVEIATHDNYKSTYKIDTLGKVDTVTLFADASISGVSLVNFTAIKDKTYDAMTQVDTAITTFDPTNTVIPPEVNITVTDLYTHFNVPNYTNFSTGLTDLDPTFSTEANLVQTWSSIQTAPGVPVGTTTRTGMLDVNIAVSGTNTRTSEYSINGIEYSQEIVLCSLLITIGNISHSSIGTTETPRVLRENFIQPTGGILLQLLKTAAQVALTNAVSSFTADEIENQLSIYV